MSFVHRLPMVIAFYIFIFLPELSAVSSSELERRHLRGSLHTPCYFFQTVNVTGDPKFANGSYLHDGIIIPHHYIGVYNYIYIDPLTQKKVKPHLRGCICKMRTCINICCPVGHINNGEECVESVSESEWPRTLNLTENDGSLRTVNIFEQFAVIPFRPCLTMFALEPQRLEEDTWKIFKNGTVLREYDEYYLSPAEYCMVLTMGNSTNSTTYYLNPANCDTEDGSYETMKIINAYAMLFSIPFMALTILVYLFIPELRNQHGKSLVCYLFGLIVGYSMLCVNALNTTIDTVGISCKVVGYTAYYSFMAAFFWLSVISFDLWHNFRGTKGINRFQEKKRYLMYSLYSWGVPLLFLAVTIYMQEYVDVPSEWQPGIGGGEYCWINMLSWAGLIYFFAPIMGLILANIIMFIMTAMKIHKVQKEMARIMAREDSTRNLRNEKDKFGLFLRLFLVMGVTWSLEIISYFVGSKSAWSKIFYAADIGNAIQGFLIFMLFVMKRKVKQLLTNRYSSTRETSSSQQRQSQYSTKTISSSVCNLTTSASLKAPEKPLIKHYERTTSLG